MGPPISKADPVYSRSFGPEGEPGAGDATRTGPTHRPPTIEVHSRGLPPDSRSGNTPGSRASGMQKLQQQETMVEDSHESSKDNNTYNRDLSEGELP